MEQTGYDHFTSLRYHWLTIPVISATLPPVLFSPRHRHSVLRLRTLAMSVCVTLCLGLNAAKADDIDKLLVERGLLGKIGDQLDQATQTVRDKASDLVFNAMGFLGVPYRRGGNSVETGGFDCSGFVRAMYDQTVGIVLPRKASEQAAATQEIDKSELKPGDLVFFNTMRSAFSHVGIYVGDNKFVHSPKPGASVRVEDMRTAYWDRRFNGARRVPGAEGMQVPIPTQTVDDTANRRSN
jgi:NlpC/P60 family